MKKLTVAMRVGIYLVAGLVAIPGLWAQRNLREIPEPSVESELRKFEVADGFEVNLFASDPLLAKPIQINFDPSGRLWVASSVTYPQIKPDGEPEDRIVVVEDLDGNGVADRSTLFADDLLIPNGVMPGDGGAYVAQAGELLHLRDTDGDGRADSKRVLLSGFGTQDTHHTIHGLTWGPDGWLYLLQGYYIATHVETLYGPRRLNGGGAWRYQPGTGRLEIYSRGLVNPWGIQFDRWGQTLQTDGAGGEGINYSFPGATFRASPGELRFLSGLNPGSPKLCGIEILSGRHLPDDMQGQVVANDFRANRMNRFRLTDNGSGFTSTKLDDLLRSKHVSFRPIDIAMGPDGAIYLADWYSPIIQHGEVSFRDPRRDHAHGRVWRITATGRPVLPRIDFVQRSDRELLDLLKEPEDYSRRQARRVLIERYQEPVGLDDVTRFWQLIDEWQAGLDRSEAEFEHHLLELMWLRQSLGWPDSPLIERLVESDDHRVRAAAVRCLGDWQSQLDGGFDWLKSSVLDSHPRVRLAAVRALVEVDRLEAVSALALAIDLSSDEFLEYALWRAFRELQRHWLPAVQRGDFDFNGNTEHLIYALQALGSSEAVASLVALVQGESSAGRRELNIWKTVSRVGNEAQLDSVWEVVSDSRFSRSGRASLIQGILQSHRERGVSAVPSEDRLTPLLEDSNRLLRMTAIEAAGEFEVKGTDATLRSIAESPDLDAETRERVFWAIGQFRGWLNESIIAAQIADLDDVGQEAKLAALLVPVSPGLAAVHASRLIRQAPDGAKDWMPLVRAFLNGRSDVAKLEQVLAHHPIEALAARAILNEVGATGREFGGLTGVLVEAAAMDSNWSELSAEETKALAQLALSQGDVKRGEALFKGEALLCMTCHAVGNDGGKVGPELGSIGASAPVDYLLESLIRPNAAIKEGYGTVSVETNDGEYFAGVKLQESSESLILRGVTNEPIVIPIRNIHERNRGRSLMPEGLVDSLPRQELLDLVRFLSTLGK